MALLLDDADAPQNVLVWTKDDSGMYQTHLINGNKNHTFLVASIPRMLLTTDQKVFELETTTETILLCDCPKWQESDFDGECPQSMQSADSTKLQLVQLNEVNANESSSQGAAPINLLQEETTDIQTNQLVQYKLKSSIEGNIGPYLFIQYALEYQHCNEKAVTKNGFRIFNVESSKFESILSEDEYSQMEKTEKNAAYETIIATSGFEKTAPSDLTLSLIQPVFFYGLGFSIGFKFEAKNHFETSQNNWQDYSKAVTIQSKKIPKKLTPYALAPSVVRNLTPIENVTVGGWNYVNGTEEKVEAILQSLFNTPPKEDSN